MSRIIWSPQAEQDLRSIRNFIARDSRLYAQRLLDRIKQAVAGCRRFPEAAAVVPEFGDPQVREIFVATYRVIYRIDGDAIHVLTVLHSARRLGDLS